MPVALFCAAEQYTNDVLREVALVAAARPSLDEGHLFGELLAAADRSTHRPAFAQQRIAESVRLAALAGEDRVSVDLEADERAAEQVVAWDALLSRFDEMSRAEQLLTLPSSPEVAAFRAWYAREVVEQVRTGRPPVPWTSVSEATLAGATR